MGLNYMFTNSRYRMHGVSLHNVCIVHNMNGCVPILYVCFDVMLSMIMMFELMCRYRMCVMIRVMKGVIYLALHDIL